MLSLRSPSGAGALALVPQGGGGAKHVHLRCCLNVGGRCKRALATRQCFGCRDFDPLGLGFVCEACYAARHPWFRSGHDFVMLRQRPLTPPKHVVVDARAEANLAEVSALLAATKASTAQRASPPSESARSSRLAIASPSTTTVAPPRSNRASSVTATPSSSYGTKPCVWPTAA